MHIINALWVSLGFIFLFQHPVNAQEVMIDAKTLHILYYENIEYEEDPYQFLNGLPLNDFENHLKFFKNNSYQVIALEDLQNETITADPIGDKYIAIILNANDNDALEKALPLLKRYGYPVHFSDNPSDFNFKKGKKDTIKNPLLNISSGYKNVDFSQKNLNDETSRFRDIFDYTPRSLFLDDIELYGKYSGVFGLYNYNSTFIPTGQANDIDNLGTIYHYINVQPSFSNLDIISTYLNRATFPFKNLNATALVNEQSNKVDLSWGITLPPALINSQNLISCVTSDGEKVALIFLEDRVEIRHSRDMNSEAVKVHCTMPILDKNSNITDTYRYMMLHEAL